MAKAVSRVAVIDDETVLAWALGQLLMKAGYEVVTFTDPLTALNALRESPMDLVISDVVMPKMSGIDLAIHLAQEQADCKVILLSGQANTLELLTDARAQGFDFEVFPKPMPANDLLRLVESRV